jgi:hypothetical protein
LGRKWNLRKGRWNAGLARSISHTIAKIPDKEEVLLRFHSEYFHFLKPE